MKNGSSACCFAWLVHKLHRVIAEGIGEIEILRRILRVGVVFDPRVVTHEVYRGEEIGRARKYAVKAIESTLQRPIVPRVAFLDVLCDMPFPTAYVA